MTSLHPDYTITDLSDRVVIKIVFKGHSASKCDIVVADLYAKFNLSPYFLIVNFPEFVSVTNVIASAKGQELVVHIGKVEPEKWKKYPWELPGPEELKKRQEESLERLLEYERKKAAQKKQEEEEEKKKSLQKSWDIEKEQRKTLEERIEEEKKYAQDLLAGKYLPEDDIKEPNINEQPLAPTRSKQVCVTTHTPTFKNLAARYDGPLRKFISPQKGDMSPQWMKDSGDTFFKDGAYTSAVNAYTKAIEGSDRQFCAAFSNRALARMKLGYYEFALQDCNEGLALIHDPIVSQEICILKVRLLSRKVFCLFKLGKFLDAFQANTEILKYIKKDEKVKKDLEQIALLAGDKIKGLKPDLPHGNIEEMSRLKTIIEDGKEEPIDLPEVKKPEEKPAEEKQVESN
ncbi:hypothetical protein TVAG_380030 [Trichomonas vaginalis G3]|uniref:TPR Domain containing protein n=1 Tax=Trichomonas vaginalis (strain ATCC PRA-98 / G3) TaxID=412133 RepID=A2DXE1_TRIV3|nr:dynein assembly factor 4, axonemal family [Trichomonas vaginalis G3]EAY14893.1 hypothetical protein TVAG_380030 [Trichomonas vaginalis G3]KAI5485448.1 dynein assembly factor 4, axonemal family [Trichomonas vaginalis G3]|eukprot:XP_001327116.1 hypothetical protein [Trichomonas vaginalis G3]